MWSTHIVLWYIQHMASIYSSYSFILLIRYEWVWVWVAAFFLTEIEKFFSNFPKLISHCIINSLLNYYLDSRIYHEGKILCKLKLFVYRKEKENIGETAATKLYHQLEMRYFYIAILTYVNQSWVWASSFTSLLR